jgi:predicted dehydrogenase
MTQRTIRVGIVGADNKTGWARVSHIPAISSLPGVKLAAVSTRTEQRAREAARPNEASASESVTCRFDTTQQKIL